MNPGGISYDALLIATGMIMQFALAYFIEWLSGIGWSGKKAPAPAGRSASHGCCRRRPRRHLRAARRGPPGSARPIDHLVGLAEAVAAR